MDWRILSAVFCALVMGGEAAADPASGQQSSTPGPAPIPEAVKANVVRLLDALKTGDQEAFDQIAPKFVVMMAPDFAAPAKFGDAEKFLGPCSFASVSHPKPLEAVPAYLVTASANCPSPAPSHTLQFDFVSDATQVWGVYPGGFERFYPKQTPGTRQGR